MSSTTEIEKTKRGLSLEKRCWFNPYWSTVQSLGHNWSCRSWIYVCYIWMESEDIGLELHEESNIQKDRF